MNTQPMTVKQIGYPDFWPLVLERHKKFFDVTQTLGPTIDDLFSVAHRSHYKVCRHLAKMVAQFARCRAPSRDERIRRRRDQAYTHDVRIGCHCGVPEKTPRRVRRLLDFHFIIAMNRHHYMEKHCPATSQASDA